MNYSRLILPLIILITGTEILFCQSTYNSYCLQTTTVVILVVEVEVGIFSTGRVGLTMLGLDLPDNR